MTAAIKGDMVFHNQMLVARFTRGIPDYGGDSFRMVEPDFTAKPHHDYNAPPGDVEMKELHFYLIFNVDRVRIWGMDGDLNVAIGNGILVDARVPVEGSPAEKANALRVVVGMREVEHMYMVRQDLGRLLSHYEHRAKGEAQRDGE